MRYIHPDGGVRHGRTLGENDYQIHMGHLQHRLMYRPRKELLKFSLFKFVSRNSLKSQNKPFG